MVCGRCGQENPEGFAFCGSCGAALDGDEAGQQQRKTVTVVFCDLAGSTALGDSTDPEVLEVRLRRYFERMQRSSSGTAAQSRSSSATPSWRSSACRSRTRTTPCARCGRP